MDLACIIMRAQGVILVLHLIGCSHGFASHVATGPGISSSTSTGTCGVHDQQFPTHRWHCPDHHTGHSITFLSGIGVQLFAQAHAANHYENVYDHAVEHRQQRQPRHGHRRLAQDRAARTNMDSRPRSPQSRRLRVHLRPAPSQQLDEPDDDDSWGQWKGQPRDNRRPSTPPSAPPTSNHLHPSSSSRNPHDVRDQPIEFMHLKRSSAPPALSGKPRLHFEKKLPKFRRPRSAPKMCSTTCSPALPICFSRMRFAARAATPNRHGVHHTGAQV